MIDYKEQNINFTNKIKSNKIINYINRFLRSKSATYVFIKSLAGNPKINNYLYDFFSKFISRLSDNNPLLYGSLAILLAIVLGVVGAGGRELLSRYKHIFLIKN